MRQVNGRIGRRKNRGPRGHVIWPREGRGRERRGERRGESGGGVLLRGSMSRDGRSSRSRDRSRDVAGAMKRLLMNRGRVDGSLSQAVDGIHDRARVRFDVKGGANRGSGRGDVGRRGQERIIGGGRRSAGRTRVEDTIICAATATGATSATDGQLQALAAPQLCSCADGRATVVARGEQSPRFPGVRETRSRRRLGSPGAAALEGNAGGWRLATGDWSKRGRDGAKVSGGFPSLSRSTGSE